MAGWAKKGGQRGKRKAHLDDLVPSSRDDDGVERVRGEPHARDPLGVTVLLDVELALAEGVPELDRAVARARDDLTVVGRERDGEDVGLVTLELAGGKASVEVPKTEGGVPGGGERELACENATMESAPRSWSHPSRPGRTVGRDDNVRDEVVLCCFKE